MKWNATSDRRLACVVCGSSVAALAALFWPVLFRRVFVYADLGNFFLPMRLFLAENLARGITPLWMPDLFCGFYAHGEGQIGIFQPLRWLLYRLLPAPEAFNVECILSYPLALAGVALFLRRLALPASAAWFGGATFAFSAYLTLRHPSELDRGDRAPRLAARRDRDADAQRARSGAHARMLAVALLTGSQLLIGYPPGIVYCWIIALPCALFTGARPMTRSLVVLATALGAGILLAAIQIVPTWDTLTTSLRSDPGYEWRTFLSLHPVDLLSVMAPWWGFLEPDLDPVERVTYFGVVAPIAAHWVWLHRKQLGPWKPLASGLIVLSCLALVLALGQYNGLYRYFLALPVVGWLRIPARYTIVLFFTGAVLTALAFADLLAADPSRPARRRNPWIWSIPAASWVVAAIALVTRAFDPAFQKQLESASAALHRPISIWIAIAPVMFTLAGALFTAAARGRASALLVLVPLALADQVACAAALWWVDPPQTLDEYRASIAIPPAIPPSRVDTPERFGRFFAPDGDGNWRSATSLIVHGARRVGLRGSCRPAVSTTRSPRVCAWRARRRSWSTDTSQAFPAPARDWSREPCRARSPGSTSSGSTSSRLHCRRAGRARCPDRRKPRRSSRICPAFIRIDASIRRSDSCSYSRRASIRAGGLPSTGPMRVLRVNGDFIGWSWSRAPMR